MNNHDLESKIKALRVPERGEEYWESFPERVLAETRAAPAEQPAPRVIWPGLEWMGRLAVACLMLGFCFWQSPLPRELARAVRQDEMRFHQDMQRFESNLARLMRDEHGLHQLVEDPS